eukprot:3827296-Pleurochrysis_carterae.AAC.1
MNCHSSSKPPARAKRAHGDCRPREEAERGQRESTAREEARAGRDTIGSRKTKALGGKRGRMAPRPSGAAAKSRRVASRMSQQDIAGNAQTVAIVCASHPWAHRSGGELRGPRRDGPS